MTIYEFGDMLVDPQKYPWGYFNMFMSYPLEYDGNNDYTNIGNIPVSSGDFTIEIRIQFLAYDNGFFLSNGTGEHDNRIFCNIRDNKKVRFFIRGGGLSGSGDIESTNEMDLNTWYDIVFRRSGGSIWLYVDQILENNRSGLTTQSVDGGRDWYIGARQDGSGPCNCRISRLTIWSELKDIEDTFLPVQGGEPNLMAHYPHTEGAGSVLGDASPNRMHGDIVGATWLSAT